jgi:hypothetical protein
MQEIKLDKDVIAWPASAQARPESLKHISVNKDSIKVLNCALADSHCAEE